MTSSFIRVALVAVAASTTLLAYAADGAVRRADMMTQKPSAARATLSATPPRGVWTAERKRAAMRNCEARFATVPDRLRACLRTIPLDGDWATLGPRRP